MKQRIVYIAGYGRSGSTLLERLLSSHERIFGTGELADFTDMIQRTNVYCSCGAKITECPVWSEIIDGHNPQSRDQVQLKRIQKSFESLASLPKWIFTSRRVDWKLYKGFTEALLSSIFQQLPKEVDYVIDSSKTARERFFRPLALSRLGSYDVKVIHLVRDGRGCMWSNLRGHNRKLEGGLEPHLPFTGIRTAMSWFIANLAAHLFQITQSPENYCRIRYEDLISHPTATLRKLSAFLGVSLEEQIRITEGKGTIPQTHQLSGNRLRFKKRVSLDLDVEWKRELQWNYRLLFWLLDWPLALLYGYR